MGEQGSLSYFSELIGLNGLFKFYYQSSYLPYRQTLLRASSTSIKKYLPIICDKLNKKRSNEYETQRIPEFLQKKCCENPYGDGSRFFCLQTPSKRTNGQIFMIGKQKLQFGWYQRMKGNMAFLPRGYLSPNSLRYLLCLSKAQIAICTTENTVKMQAVQFLVKMEQVSQPSASQKQLAQLTKLKPYPQGIWRSLAALEYSFSLFALGDFLKPPRTLWHLQFKNSKMAQRPTKMQVVFCEFGCPDGKKNSSMELKRAKRTQQWKLLMITLLKGIDSLLKTWTQPVSYSRFRQCRTPKTKPTVWTFVQDSFLPSKQKRGRMRMGPKYSIQNTISHLICLPKFLTVSTLVVNFAILSGIQLSERTCLTSPSLQESSC